MVMMWNVELMEWAALKKCVVVSPIIDIITLHYYMQGGNGVWLFWTISQRGACLAGRQCKITCLPSTVKEDQKNQASSVLYENKPITCIKKAQPKITIPCLLYTSDAADE